MEIDDMPISHLISKIIQLHVNEQSKHLFSVFISHIFN